MNRSRTGTILILTAGLACSHARAQSTMRESLGTGGAQGFQPTYSIVISSDGRFAAFASNASNLVAGDTNSSRDIFVRDRLNGTTERVSVSSAGAQGNADSDSSSISADGRFVAFESFSTNLVAGDTNVYPDVFVRDRLNGTTERVSVSSAGIQGYYGGHSPSISADGRFVAFESIAANLVSNDNNGDADVFVRDRLNGTTALVSVNSAGTQGNAGSYSSSISADGRFVAFASIATNLAPGDTNGARDIFVRDRLGGTTQRVSVDSAGVQANGYCSDPAISGDSGSVAFSADASNLVAGDTNGVSDVFVFELQSGITDRVSVSSAGVQANGPSSSPRISADGRRVAFDSLGTNLVAGDTNGDRDVFARDRQGGTTERVSVSWNGAQGLFASWATGISADGSAIAFASRSNFVAGDTNGVKDGFVRALSVPPNVFCLAFGSTLPCPCTSTGLFGGCDNSAGTGGAVLGSSGNPSVWEDALVLASSSQIGNELSIFIQGTLEIAPVYFGDGLRCTGGILKRLYVHNAAGGVVSAPQGTDATITARSAALGDTLLPGARRFYQVYYRDLVPGFCPNPPGNNWNVSSGLSVVWSQ